MMNCGKHVGELWLAITATFGLATDAWGVTQTISLSGDNAEGYFAMAGLNQEGNTALEDIIRDPTDAKFFDYPAYVTPGIPENIYVFAVESYRFGLSYPELLHPTGPRTFVSVGTLEPSGTIGVTFIEATTQDADFSNFDLVEIIYDDASLTGTGTEFLNAAELTLN